MQQVSEQQGEVKKLGLVIMEATVRISENSKRWSGWTPRKQSKVDDMVRGLADFLNISTKEREEMFSPQIR